MPKSILIIPLILALAAPAFADRRVYRFDEPAVTLRGDHSEATIGDLPLTTAPGEPALPFLTARILLPHGKTVRGVAVEAAPHRALPGKHLLRRAPRILPHSYAAQLESRRRARELELRANGPEPLAAGPFPAAAHDNFSVQTLHGAKILVVNLYPLVHHPAARRLDFTPELTVRFEPVDDPAARDAWRGRPADRDRLRDFCDDHAALSTYPVNAGREAPGYLIVSSGALLDYRGEDSFDALAARLARAGYRVETARVEEILRTSPGRDGAEKLRAFLAAAAREQNVRLVLLGGDGDDRSPVIPVRRLHARFAWDGETFDQKLPADVYYACLDGTFDGNGDGVFGDPDDGEAGGDVDLAAELLVGRATVQTTDELRNFVRKTIRAHDLAAAGGRRTALFVGENLFPGVYGSSYMAEVEKGAAVHGFATAGFPEGFPRDRLDDAPGYSWGRADAAAKLNAGAYWVNHIGHSAQYSNMRFYSSPAGVANAEPYLLYTQGCLCGQFTYADCIVEKHLTARTAAFATISNSHYGLGPEDPDDDATVTCRGASQYFHRQFVDAVFAEGKVRIGEANGDSKEDNLPFMNHGTTRWVFFELNLFGDPAVPLVP